MDIACLCLDIDTNKPSTICLCMFWLGRSKYFRLFAEVHLPCHFYFLPIFVAKMIIIHMVRNLIYKHNILILLTIYDLLTTYLLSFIDLDIARACCSLIFMFTSLSDNSRLSLGDLGLHLRNILHVSRCEGCLYPLLLETLIFLHQLPYPKSTSVKFTWIYLFKHKYDVFQAFHNFHNLGGEYETLNSFFQQIGISHRKLTFLTRWKESHGYSIGLSDKLTCNKFLVNLLIISQVNCLLDNILYFASLNLVDYIIYTFNI
ncbi:hypothetical protein ACJX0J_024681 [Zea mays]